MIKLLIYGFGDNFIWLYMRCLQVKSFKVTTKGEIIYTINNPIDYPGKHKII